MACLYQQPNATRELIKWGASPTGGAPDARGLQPPMASALQGGGSSEVIDELVAAGAAPPPAGAAWMGHALGQMHRVAPSCDACGKTPGPSDARLLTCGVCHTRRYCSTACQRAAWKGGHKAECASLAKAVVPPSE